ncbi:MAG: monofunctional biosynthetic peptidoglycan transglycosylase [Gammaproteobacteria bacterium]|nr:monofunctional biosynthetic peptidoglycan transglycosylase [Gammaproteobacteria bacterium]
MSASKGFRQINPDIFRPARKRRVKKRRHPVRRLLAWTAVILLTLFLGFNLWVLAKLWWWTDHAPQASAFMEARLARLQEKDPEADLHFRWVPYERISIQLKRAVVAAEDARFMEHEGFDWEGIEAAFNKNLKQGSLVAGGSTISQQLAKNLFLSGRRSFLRKGEEALITVMIEAIWSKRRILEVYLNVVEWGERVYGAEAAARRYYRVSSDALTPEQSARLAAMLPRPGYYETHPDSRWLGIRTRMISRYMRQVRVPR